MATIATYARPTSISEALRLIEEDGAMVIGGGTSLAGRPPGLAAKVVDLQSAGLDGIEVGGDRALVGAMVTLDELRRCEALPATVRDAARRELPSTLRTRATIGGLLATGAGDSELLALLLVHDSVVTVVTGRSREHLPLGRYLSSRPRPRGEVVTALALAVSGKSASRRTARTRADRPIVAAAARAAPDGSVRLALSGVAATPVLVASEGVGGPALLDLAPPSDFRGSAGYRAALAELLSQRVLEEVS
jgi:CO/xanthine dehydrogenase FAD-binding subunit